MTVKFLFSRYQEIVDHYIGLLLRERDEHDAPKGLTQQDLFYREVILFISIAGN